MFFWNDHTVIVNEIREIQFKPCVEAGQVDLSFRVSMQAFVQVVLSILKTLSPRYAVADDYAPPTHFIFYTFQSRLPHD